VYIFTLDWQITFYDVSNALHCSADLPTPWADTTQVRRRTLSALTKWLRLKSCCRRGKLEPGTWPVGGDEIVNEELVFTQIFDHSAVNLQRIPMCDIPKRPALKARHFDVLGVEIDPNVAQLPSKVGFSDVLKLLCIAVWTCSRSLYNWIVRAQRAGHFDVSHV
jgi:hypothetical protein